MALVLKDRVRESSSTSGTGTITLAGAATGFDSFASIGDGNTTYYAIIDTIAGEWEVGLGTYTASGTTLSRDTVLESSNSDTLVNFAANTKDVICTYPADKSVFLSADGSLSLPGALSATGAVTGSNLNVSNWDTAYGWGDHASAGYVIADGAVVINESGADVDFRIESDTDVNAFFLEGSNGNVGIGTSGPSYKLDVKNGTTYSSSSDDWLVAIQQNTNAASYNGLSVMNAWASPGSKIFEAAMGWNGVTPGYYPVFTIDGLGQAIFAPQNLEAMRINLSGNVGIGTASPSTKLDVNGSVTASGDVTAYSDERLKENWKDLPEGFVESLAGVKSGTYNRIDLNGKQQVGVSAQSLQTVLPDAVRELNDTLTVNYGNAALASAIELAKKVVELEARIKELEVK
jgi:hypothetical protein